MRRFIAALLLALSLAPSLARAQTVIPALPDSERRTAYILSASTCSCSVGWALYGDGSDYSAWLEVWLTTGSGSSAVSTKLTAVTDYTVTSVSGTLSTLARPITNAIVTLSTARTGTLQIVGSRRPRRTSQFTENRGVTAHDLNQVLTDIIASNRETWDRTNDVTGRALLTPPGDTIAQLPAAAARAGGVLAFDSSGNPLAAAALTGLGNVVGPNTSVVGHIPVFANTSGTLLSDGGLIGTGDFVGPASSTANHAVTFSNTTGKLGKDSGLTLTPSTGTITLVNAKTLTVDNTLEFSGTDSSVVAFGGGGTVTYTSNNLSVFAATTSAQLLGVISDETGTGPLVFANTPTLVTPVLGVATATSINKVAFTAPASSATLTIADGKTLTDTSGIGASVLLGATGGGFAAYAGASCTNQFIRSLSAAAAATCASVANADLTNSSLTIGSTSVSLGGTAATVAGLTLTAPTINGGTHTAITSLGIRSTGSGAFDLTVRNTENLTAGRILTVTVENANRTIDLSGNLTIAADFITAGGNAITLTGTGVTNVTLPTSGTLATTNTAQTFSGANVFSALQTFTDIKLSSGKIYPSSDGTTALQITKADGSTRIVNFDTTNARVGINKSAGAYDLDVNGAVNVGTTLTFTTLDATSLGASPSTITGLTVNNSPNSSNDYLLYYNAASGAIRRATVSAITSAGVAGVSSLNGLTGGLSVVASTGLSVSAASTSVTLANYLDAGALNNCTLTGTVAANALTVALKTQAGADPSASSPCAISFRNATNATGDYTVVSVTAATSFATATSGSTFGSSSGGHPFRLWVVAINNGGTVVLGVTELSNANTNSPPKPLNEGVVQSTTACNACGTATALGTIYSTAAQTNKAIRILGYMDWGSGLTTAGTWASGPTNIQLMGPGVKKPGDIVQSIYAASATSKAYSNTTPVQTDLTASITLTASANMVAASAYGQLEGATANVIFRAQISRGTSTRVGTPAEIYQNQGAGAFQYGQAMFAYDNPETTSATSYFVYIVCDTTCSGNWNNNTQTTGMRLDEIMGALPEPANDNIDPGVFSKVG